MAAKKKSRFNLTSAGPEHGNTKSWGDLISWIRSLFKKK